MTKFAIDLIKEYSIINKIKIYLELHYTLLDSGNCNWTFPWYLHPERLNLSKAQ